MTRTVDDDAVRGPRFAVVPSALLMILLVGCPVDSFNSQLRMENLASFDIKTFVNVAYPDSALANSRGDKHIEAGQELFVGSYYDLTEYEGITIFVYRYDYYLDHWHQGVGTPDTYLDEDSTLARYYLSRKQLDSLNWQLTFP